LFSREKNENEQKERTQEKELCEDRKHSDGDWMMTAAWILVTFDEHLIGNIIKIKLKKLNKTLKKMKFWVK
jgi:hypothetical protein